MEPIAPWVENDNTMFVLDRRAGRKCVESFRGNRDRRKRYLNTLCGRKGSEWHIEENEVASQKIEDEEEPPGYVFKLDLGGVSGDSSKSLYEGKAPNMDLVFTRFCAA
jgi:hypothetical protein